MLMCEDAPQRDYPLREPFNRLRSLVRYGNAWRAMPQDFPAWSAVWQQTRRRLAKTIQGAAGENIALVFVEQGYARAKPAAAACSQGIELQVVKLPKAKRGLVLLRKRWVVVRTFAWATRFRRLVKDYERHAATRAGLHVVAFVCPMGARAAGLMRSA